MEKLRKQENPQLNSLVNNYPEYIPHFYTFLKQGFFSYTIQICVCLLKNVFECIDLQLSFIVGGNSEKKSTVS